MTTLCDLATGLPQLVGSLLDREGALARGRFREETLTDIFTGALAAFAGPNLMIEYPPEADTGGDLDIDFWDVNNGTFYGLRLQAKRLSAAKHGGRPIKASMRAYNELFHTVKSTKKFQFRTLLDESHGRLPLYMFYNHSEITRDAVYAGTEPEVKGINLAFAADIAEMLEDELLAKSGPRTKRLHNRRLQKLQPFFFGLDSIFCTGATTEVPTPEAVANSLSRLWYHPPDSSDDVTYISFLSRFISHGRFPGVRVDIDDRALQFRMETGVSRPVSVNMELQRPRLTFLSGRKASIDPPPADGAAI